MSVPSPVQHRFYLGRAEPDADLDRAAAHWFERHAPVVRDMPRLRGYVQNRPLPDQRTSTPWFTCAETWFDDRDDEQAAYASAYYTDVIAVDERNVITPDGAWNAAVTRTEVVRGGARGAVRILALTPADLPADATAVTRAEVLHVRRPTPDGHDAISSWWTDDEAAARSLAAALPGTVLLCHSVAVVGPLDDTWLRSVATSTEAATA